MLFVCFLGISRLPEIAMHLHNLNTSSKGTGTWTMQIFKVNARSGAYVTIFPMFGSAPGTKTKAED
jgi:hypothetical protein